MKSFIGQLPVTDQQIAALALHDDQHGIMVCIVCGCDDEHACVGLDNVGCHWVEEFLCSGCASAFPQGASMVWTGFDLGHPPEGGL